jgi:hypothetical protein
MFGQFHLPARFGSAPSQQVLAVLVWSVVAMARRWLGTGTRQATHLVMGVRTALQQVWQRRLMSGVAQDCDTDGGLSRQLGPTASERLTLSAATFGGWIASDGGLSMLASASHPGRARNQDLPANAVMGTMAANPPAISSTTSKRVCKRGSTEGYHVMAASKSALRADHFAKLRRKFRAGLIHKRVK